MEEAADLVNGVDRWAQATMDAKDVIVYNGRQAQVIEDFGAVAPDINAAVLS